MSGKAQNEYGSDPGVWSGQEDLPVGALLKKARDHYELSIEDVERALRIRASHLIALEEGRIDRLPGRVYAIGFARSYAEYLGLDGARIVSMFKKEAGAASRRRPELSFPVPASESRLPDIKILLPSFAGLVLILALIAFLSGGKNEQAAIPPATTTAAAAPGAAFDARMPMETAFTQTVTAGGMPAPMPSTADSVIIGIAAGAETAAMPPPNRVVITAIENAWVEIRDPQGTAMLSRILKTGDIYKVPDGEGMVLSTGNAGGLAFTVDGKQGIMIGKTGDILRKVSIGPADLAAVGTSSEEAAAQAASFAADAPAPPPVKTPPPGAAQKRRATPPADAPIVVRTPRDREGM
ncbi:MAG: DUF4115 domain-containing protein [Proteobacteria bacterium]|nr:DUF4115 domain-containing protein [Pseudomonadota bacterium]